MILKTKYDIGDKVYPAYPCLNEIPLTIGQVRKSITDSPGIDGETLFDNYKPQKKEMEEYMCVESGIGSGSVYPIERLFDTYEEAKTCLDKVTKKVKNETRIQRQKARSH